MKTKHCYVIFAIDISYGSDTHSECKYVEKVYIGKPNLDIEKIHDEWMSEVMKFKKQFEKKNPIEHKAFTPLTNNDLKNQKKWEILWKKEWSQEAWLKKYYGLININFTEIEL